MLFLTLIDFDACREFNSSALALSMILTLKDETTLLMLFLWSLH
ncbi:Uncharacterised protein [Yersinia enterocolitica]|nr:Uncharacterised protein [Yersinia enterocolitica]CNF21627.1 Uncharacterised protein [Yersinia mollaretii]CQJ53319.1 Uncharacterised protein [Yersinia enterocolitica]